MKSVIKWVFILLNAVAALALLLSYLSAFVNPQKVPILGVLSLGYLALLGINLVFVLLWLFAYKKYFLISLIAICLRIDYLPAFFQFGNSEKTEQTDANAFKIMTFNLHAFRNIDEWVREPESVDKTLELIKENEPDIICFQEFYSNKKKGNPFNVVERIKKETSLKYYCASFENKNSVRGNIILSKFPILKGDTINGSNSDGLRSVWADILLDKDTIRLYNLHLTSFRLDDFDAKAFEDMTEKVSFEKEKSKTILRKLRTAQTEHGKEADILKKHMTNCGHKTFICGDFNDSPSSYVYRQLIKNKKDAFREKGSGFGNTYNGKFPAFRIDYILMDPQFSTLDFKVHPVDFSDHYPVFASIQKLK